LKKIGKMEIIKNIKIIDLALYLTKSKTLIIADSHIGFEESLNKQGILVPRFHFKDLIQRLEKILKKVKPDTIIINGDIKHELGTISEQEWRYTLRLIDFLGKHCSNLFLVRGNHDKILGPIAKKRNIDVVNQIIMDNILITHGDKLIKIPKQIKTRLKPSRLLMYWSRFGKYLVLFILISSYFFTQQRKVLSTDVLINFFSMCMTS